MKYRINWSQTNGSKFEKNSRICIQGS
jgi:hypothetical protein